MLDDTINKNQKTNPYEADGESAKVQRSFYVPLWIWEAAEGLPGGRPQAIIQSLLDRITAFKSEIPQLKYDVQQIDLQIEALQVQRVAKLNRIAELEKADEEGIKANSLVNFAIEQAVLESIDLLKMYRRDLGQIHYKRLEGLSGISAIEIKDFFKEKKFMPSEDEIRLFYMR